MPSLRLTNAVAAVALIVFAGTAVWAQKGGAAAAQSQGGGTGGGQSGATPYFETEMLAYGAANQIAQAVAQRVCNAKPQFLTPDATILIYDQQTFQNLGAWQSFATGAELLADAYNTLPKGNRVQLLGPSFIQGGADLGSLITSIAASTLNNASTFSIPNETMAVSLMHAFERINCNKRIIYYPLFGSYADVDAATSAVQHSLKQLNDARQAAQVNAANAKSTDILYSELTDLNTQYDALLKNFLTLPGQSAGPGGSQSQGPAGGPQAAGNSPAPSSTSVGAVSLLQGAELEELIEKENTHILYANVVASGGTQRDIKNVITLLTGDWLSYSGGVIVDVALVKSKETRLEFAATLRYRTDFHHADLWDVTGFKPLKSPRKSELVEDPNAGSNMATLCDSEGNHRPKPSRAECPVLTDSIAAEPPSSVTLTPLRFDQTEAKGGTRLAGVVSLAAPQDAAVIVQLFTSDSAVFPVPSSVTIPAGSLINSFAVQTGAVPEQRHIVVSEITDGSAVQSVGITLNPALLSFAEQVIKGGSKVKGTVTLRNPAPKGGAQVALVTSDPTVTVPNAVQFDSGASSMEIEITAKAVLIDTSVVISAMYNNEVESVRLVVEKE